MLNAVFHNRKSMIKAGLSLILAISAAVPLISKIKEIDDTRPLRNLQRLNRLKMSFRYLAGFDQGQTDFEAERFGVYDDYYREVLDRFPQFQEALAMRGYCAYFAGHAQQAVQFYEEALAAYPDVILWNYNLGLLYYQQNQYDRAAENFKRAVAGDPGENIQLYQNSLIYRQVMADIPDAKNVIPRQMADVQGKAWILLMSIYDKQKNSEALAQVALPAIERMKDNTSALFYGGKAAYVLGQYDMAAKLLLAYIQQDVSAAKPFHWAAESLAALEGDPVVIGKLRDAAARISLQEPVFLTPDILVPRLF